MAVPSRRVKLWLKRSISSRLTADPSLFIEDDELKGSSCQNVDEALHAFHIDDEHVGLPVVVSETTNATENFDWVLDGERDREYHARRSRELTEMLKAPEIEEVVSLRDPVLGRQVYQFAEFPSETLQADEDTAVGSELGDAFGDFQEASSVQEEESSEESAESGAQMLSEEGDLNVLTGRESQHPETSERLRSSTNGKFSSRDKQTRKAAIVDEVFIDAEKSDAERTNEAFVTNEVFGNFQEAAATAEALAHNGSGDLSCKDATVRTPNEGGVNHEEDRNSVRAVSQCALFQSPPPLNVPHEVQADIRRTLLSIVSDNLSESEYDDDDNDSSSEDELGIDVTTLEGRFLQRKKKRKKPISVSLPQHFQEEGGDPSLEILRCFPWEQVPMCQPAWRSISEDNEEDMQEVEEHLMNQLMELDGWLSTVTTLSYRQVSERKSSLELCNQYLRELNHSLMMADIHARRSREYLKEARGTEDEFTGLTSGLFLLDAWDQRDVYRDLDQLLVNCSNLLKKEQQLQQEIDAFGLDTSRYQELIDAAKSFSRSAYEDEQLSKVVALDGLRQRADHVMVTFAKEVESVLVHQLSATCVSWDNFSSASYGNLLKAMVCIKYEGDYKVFADYWTKCIQDALFFEMEKCLARALVDPTNAAESSYDKDLFQMSFAMQQDNGDYANLKTVCHNLVTVRFDFEMELSYLPKVYHQLCLLLSDVLYGHQILVSWHERASDDFEKNLTDRIHHQLIKSRSKLWKRCEQVLVTCLTEYLTFANKKRFFDNKLDETPWIDDLQSMHDILQLTHQMTKIGRQFVGKDGKKVTCLLDESCDSALRSKLCAVFQKHLRVVHVETMTSMGIMLSRESWQLVPLEPVRDGLIGFASLETEIKAYLVKLVNEKVTNCSSTHRLWHNGARSIRKSFFEAYEKDGNPFKILSDDADEEGDFIDIRELEWTSPERADESDGDAFMAPGVYGLLISMVGPDLTFDSRIAVDSCFKGFARCIARLLVIMKKLPLIVPDVAKVLENVSDLYLATVFRVCTLNSVNERILVGLDAPTPYQMEVPVSKHRNKNAAPLLGFGRRWLHRPPQRVTARTEAEICAPLHCDLAHVESLKTYLQRAQKSLDGIVKLDMIQGWIYDPVSISPEESDAEYLCKVATALEKRQAAAWSCLLVAAILDLVKSFSVTVLTKDTFAKLLGEATVQDSGSLTGVMSLSMFVDSILQVTPKLISFATTFASIRAIGGKRIVEEICRQDWETMYLAEAANHYVELVCGRYTFIWRFMAMSGKLPISVRTRAWESLMAVGYMTLLEGFARVPTCSTEGRSLMSMDLSAFCSGLSPAAVASRLDHDAIPRPPNTATIPRGRIYVDTYIKVSYLPHDDIMKWIVENYNNYHLNHCLALTTGRTEEINVVNNLYKDDDENEELKHR